MLSVQPVSDKSFQVTGNDWMLHLAKSRLEKLNGTYHAQLDKSQGCFLFDGNIQEFPLKEINDEIATWDRLFTTIRRKAESKPCYELPLDLLQNTLKRTPRYQRFKNHPLCQCWIRNVPLTCKFCEFGCCKEAIKQRIQDGHTICPIHGKRGLEEMF
jgi:hypothetical protein